MKTKIILFFLVYFNIVGALPPNVIIRSARHNDMPALLDLDRVVSYEYFVPLYSNGYAHLPLGKNPEYFLERELEQDKKWFPECISGNAELMWVACDRDNQKIAGLIIAHQSSDATIQRYVLLFCI